MLHARRAPVARVAAVKAAAQTAAENPAEEDAPAAKIGTISSTGQHASKEMMREQRERDATSKLIRRVMRRNRQGSVRQKYHREMEELLSQLPPHTANQFRRKYGMPMPRSRAAPKADDFEMLDESGAGAPAAAGAAPAAAWGAAAAEESDESDAEDNLRLGEGYRACAGEGEMLDEAVFNHELSEIIEVRAPGRSRCVRPRPKCTVISITCRATGSLTL